MRRWTPRDGLHRSVGTAVVRAVLEMFIRIEAIRFNKHKSLHRPACEIHWACVWQRERVFMLVCSNPNHEIFTNDTTAHMPANHECKATKHLFLGNTCLIQKNFT